jgi:hypothetical protein
MALIAGQWEGQVSVVIAVEFVLLSLYTICLGGHGRGMDVS